MKIDRLIQMTDCSCLRAVLAMMIGESEDYVQEWFGKNITPPLSDEDAIIFLAHHGIYLSLFCGVPKKDRKSFKDLTDSEITIKFDNRPAYVIVESERFPGKHHAVLYDGRRVLDPSPLSKRERKLCEYRVVGFYPMMMTKERWRLLNDS